MEKITVEQESIKKLAVAPSAQKVRNFCRSLAVSVLGLAITAILGYVMNQQGTYSQDATSSHNIINFQIIGLILTLIIVPYLIMSIVVCIRFKKYDKSFLKYMIAQFVALVIAVIGFVTLSILEKNAPVSEFSETSRFPNFLYIVPAYMCDFLSLIFLLAGDARLLKDTFKLDEKIDTVLTETYNGEGAQAKEDLYKALLKSAQANDEATFLKLLNDAHARFKAREELIMSFVSYRNTKIKSVTHEIMIMATILEGKQKGKALVKECNKLYKQRNFERLTEIYNDYTKQIEVYKQNIIKSSGKQTYVPEMDGKSTFDGTLLQRIGWALLCSLVNAVTLYIAYPATLCWKQKWICKHTVYDGKRLSFDGTGLQLFGKWICWCLLTIITFGIYAFFVSKKLEQWTAKHTHIAGEYKELGGTFDGSILVWILRNWLFRILIIISFGLMIPYVECHQEKWLCKHRIYDGRRLVFSGHTMGLFGKFIIWWLLSIITLGIYSLWIPNRMLKWKAEHTSLQEGMEVAL